jgi:hypothetical protein
MRVFPANEGCTNYAVGSEDIRQGVLSIDGFPGVRDVVLAEDEAALEGIYIPDLNNENRNVILKRCFGNMPEQRINYFDEDLGEYTSKEKLEAIDGVHDMDLSRFSSSKLCAISFRIFLRDDLLDMVYPCVKGGENTYTSIPSVVDYLVYYSHNNTVLVKFNQNSVPVYSIVPAEFFEFDIYLRGRETRINLMDSDKFFSLPWNLLYAENTDDTTILLPHPQQLFEGLENVDMKNEEYKVLSNKYLQYRVNNDEGEITNIAMGIMIGANIKNLDDDEYDDVVNEWSQLPKRTQDQYETEAMVKYGDNILRDQQEYSSGVRSWVYLYPYLLNQIVKEGAVEKLQRFVRKLKKIGDSEEDWKSLCSVIDKSYGVENLKQIAVNEGYSEEDVDSVSKRKLCAMIARIVENREARMKMGLAKLLSGEKADLPDGVCENIGEDIEGEGFFVMVGPDMTSRCFPTSYLKQSLKDEICEWVPDDESIPVGDSGENSRPDGFVRYYKFHLYMEQERPNLISSRDFEKLRKTVESDPSKVFFFYLGEGELTRVGSCSMSSFSLIGGSHGQAPGQPVHKILFRRKMDLSDVEFPEQEEEDPMVPHPKRVAEYNELMQEINKISGHMNVLREGYDFDLIDATLESNDYNPDVLSEELRTAYDKMEELRIEQQKLRRKSMQMPPRWVKKSELEAEMGDEVVIEENGDKVEESDEESDEGEGLQPRVLFGDDESDNENEGEDLNAGFVDERSILDRINEIDETIEEIYEVINSFDPEIPEEFRVNMFRRINELRAERNNLEEQLD